MKKTKIIIKNCENASITKIRSGSFDKCPISVQTPLTLFYLEAR